jgi:hypothetical protein
LETRRGTLGQIKLTSGNADGLRDSTLTVIRRFCTPGYGAPYRKTTEQTLDEALITHVVNHIEQFTADAAADEQLAGRLLQNAGTRDAWDGLCNLKIITRDRAHASRRITKRPWSADTYLNMVMTKLVLGIR